MLALLQKVDSGDARRLIETMTAAVDRHRDGAEPNDDLTMMVINLT